MQEKKIKRHKWLENIALMWAITLGISGLGMLAQQALPAIFKKDEYMEMLMNQKDSLIVFMISIVICTVFAFVVTSKSEEMQRNVDKVSRNKGIRVTVTVFSIVFGSILSLIVITSVASGVATAKEVKTMSGKVDSIITTTSKTNGEVAKMVIIKDSDGKKHRFYKHQHLDDIDVNYKDNITVDYVKSAKHEPKKLDGDVLGYNSYNEKPQS